jgi:hypothetical protein
MYYTPIIRGNGEKYVTISGCGIFFGFAALRAGVAKDARI